MESIITKSLIDTKWTETVDTDNPHQEYPRPHMVRENWQCLNGKWKYAITALITEIPASFDGDIIVPFCLESKLSGVQKSLTPDNYLWYKRMAKISKPVNNRKILLHFTAVDWHTTLFINGNQVGEHTGGFTPFNYDITDYLCEEPEQEIVLRVYDPSNFGIQPKGKQRINPRGVMYTPVSGIWQTVWLETVNETYITSIYNEPMGLEGIQLTVNTNKPDKATIVLKDQDRIIVNTEAKTNEKISIMIPDARHWSPDDPFLYDIQIKLKSGDQITSYCAVRTIEVKKAADGYNRLFLNSRELFQYGPLDQGWWPDGLYTAPTEEALKYDIEYMKENGFNMVRKHEKIEPARWYYHCDKQGLLVWQDIPSTFNQETEAGRLNYERETLEMIEAFRFFPSIIMWVIFNEGWGQNGFGLDRSRLLVDKVGKIDPCRLLNSGSGWFNVGGDHVKDMHCYPGPFMQTTDATRANVIGEFGGNRIPIKNHVWVNMEQEYDINSLDFLQSHYQELLWKLEIMKAQGISAGVYTQLTDCEIEMNGYLTYDRKINKMGQEFLYRIHQHLYKKTPELKMLAGQDIDWKYTKIKPGSDWIHQEFDDSSWETALAPFGSELRNNVPRTEWSEQELWLRKTFTYRDENNPAQDVLLISWQIFGADPQIFVNGKHLAEFDGLAKCSFHYVSLKHKNILINGKNNIAIYCRRIRGNDKWNGDAALIDARIFTISNQSLGLPETLSEQYKYFT